MKRNMYGIDRFMRFVSFIAIGVIYTEGKINGLLVYPIFIFAVFLAFTCYANFCPFYKVLLNYNKKSQDKLP